MIELPKECIVDKFIPKKMFYEKYKGCNKLAIYLNNSNIYHLYELF